MFFFFYFPDGLVIIECESSGQLVLDGLTDAVVSHKFSLTGKPMLSPDSRTLLTLDNQSRHGVTLVVQHISGNVSCNMYIVPIGKCIV